MLIGLIMTFVFGRMTTKIILVTRLPSCPLTKILTSEAHLTKQPFPYWTSLLIPLFAVSIIINLPLIIPSFDLPSTNLRLIARFPVTTAKSEEYFIWGYLVFAAVIYFRWAFVVIDRICTFLDINCFTIKKQKERAN